MPDTRTSGRIAVFIPSLNGGGAERAMLYLTAGLAERGLEVDLVLSKAMGPYLSRVHRDVRVIDLGQARVIASLPGLVRYLRRERPSAMIASLEHASVVALWARRLARVSTRVIVNVQNTVSMDAGDPRYRRAKLLPPLLRLFYPQADGITAVSQGVADDLAATTGLPPHRIEVVFNPVVTPDLLELAAQPVDHPWFAAGAPPVILGVGRLTRQKRFPLLLNAFARVRARTPCRLMILGEGEDRPALEALVRELGVGDDVALPGYVANPYAYMARAGMFVLSSDWEGLPTVLIEAGAVGAPLVATDCKSGPREILDGGRYGKLVPVGDLEALSSAMLEVLEGHRPEVPAEVWEQFSQAHSVSRYYALVRGERA